VRVVRVEGEVAVRCPNRRCPDQVKAAIFHFSRRFAMDIDHLGESLIESLVSTGHVKSVADLYELTHEQVVGLERMGKKSADNLLASIEKSKERNFDRLITGLGIDHVGQVAARQLAEALHSLDVLIDLSPEALEERVRTIAGFGPKMAVSLREFHAYPEARSLLVRLQELGVSRPQPRAESAVDGPLRGMSFCVTGVLTRKREDVHAAIRNAGGEVHDKVKAGTTHLVAGDKVGASKLTAAKKAGSRVIDEASLDRLLRGETLETPA
jgi:DNA ligase (NAD+)